MLCDNLCIHDAVIKMVFSLAKEFALSPHGSSRNKKDCSAQVLKVYLPKMLRECSSATEHSFFRARFAAGFVAAGVATGAANAVFAAAGCDFSPGFAALGLCKQRT